jgi:hypothetical protein
MVTSGSVLSILITGSLKILALTCSFAMNTGQNPPVKTMKQWNHQVMM